MTSSTNSRMNVRALRILITALGVLAIIAPVSRGHAQTGSQQSQSPPQQQQPPAKPGDQGQPPPMTGLTPTDAPKVDPEEEKAYKAFADLKVEDVDKQIEAGEDFVKKYPESKYNLIVYSRLTNAYYGKQQMDKMYAAGDKALALNGDNVDVLVLIGWVIPHNIDPNDLDSDRRLAKAEGYEKHALEVLPTLVKPEGLADDQFIAAKKQKESQAHSGLGLVYFRQNKVDDSLKELQLATADSAQPDPVDYFIMGLDLGSLKRFSDAADAFQKCAQIPGGLVDRCKQAADKAKAQAAAPQK
jgi:tetratricopeptide (TPR) repeat protein